jgi:Retrotransposon gag protein
MRWLRDVTSRQHNQINPLDEQLWKTFEEEFQRSFTDTAIEQNAYKKLISLKMTEGNLNTYIVEFERLAEDVGYHSNERGTILLFRKGLPYRLHKAILEKVHPALHTLAQWQQAARDNRSPMPTGKP